MAHPRCTLLLSVVFASLAPACGGRYTSLGPGSDDGGTRSDASPADAAGDVIFPGDDEQDASPLPGPCPAAAPNEGAACSASGQLYCEYGSSEFIGCDLVMSCNQGAWQKTNFSECPPPGPNPAACPATLAAVPLGQTCTPAGLECDYMFARCFCNDPFGPPPPDSGIAPTWACDDPGPGCPQPRPRLGTACSGQQVCTYETCSYSEQCVNGYWSGEFAGCGGAGGGQ
jgi:hypothetical protein